MRVSKATDEALYHEHVTNYVYEHPSEFLLEFIDAPEIIQSNTSIRLTVDTKADFETAKAIYALAREDNDLGHEHIIELVVKHPDFQKSMYAEIRSNSK